MNASEKQKQATRKKFDKNFRREAVELWQQSGKSGADIAAELGIRANNLYNWAKHSRRAAPSLPSDKPEDLATENAALRRENERLRQQRDILKKTLGILSEPPSSATNGFTK